MSATEFQRRFILWMCLAQEFISRGAAPQPYSVNEVQANGDLDEGGGSISTAMMHDPIIVEEGFLLDSL